MAEQSNLISFVLIMGEKIEVILVDIGNTRTKCSEVINGEIGDIRIFENIQACLAAYATAIPMMISSVVSLPEELLEGRQFLSLDHKTKLPIEIDYKTPETLGPDRLAAAVGACYHYPRENNLVIDIGTCMTIDLVDKRGIYQGRVISPGLAMRMRAMHHYSGKLPDISDEWISIEVNKVGKSTKECLLSGAFLGMLNELNATMDGFYDEFTSINIIITGGDAHFFESKLKAPIFAGSKIVQEGLYCIWKNAVKRD